MNARLRHLVCTPHGAEPRAMRANARLAARARMRRRAAWALGAAFLATCLALGPASAFAETRASDIVLGKTAEERGIEASELPDISARNAIVVDRDGTAYFERGADDAIKIASITKVATALVALENASPSDIVTVSHAAAAVGESSANLREGDTLSLEEALTGLLVASGNDAATAIAEHVGKLIDPASTDPCATFVDAMNKRAAELGCTDTLFGNPHGLDFGAWTGDMHSTARDVARMYAAAMQNEAFRELVSSTRTSIRVTDAAGAARTQAIPAHNRILGQHGNIGGKTGTTFEAGECFVGGFLRTADVDEDGEGREIYVAVFGSNGDEARFADTLALANWYYGHWAKLPFANTSVKRGDVPIVAQAPILDWTDKTVGAALDDPAQSALAFSLAGAVEQNVAIDELHGDIEKGQRVGSIAYAQDGRELGKAGLVATDSVAAPSPLEWVMVQFDRVVRFFQGKPGAASERVHNEAPDPLAFDAV